MCDRCGNKGWILERYYDMETEPLVTPFEVKDVSNLTYEIKTRKAECPDCLGFGTAWLYVP